MKPGVTFGETDDYCYNIVKDPVHVHMTFRRLSSTAWESIISA